MNDSVGHHAMGINPFLPQPLPNPLTLADLAHFRYLGFAPGGIPMVNNPYSRGGVIPIPATNPYDFGGILSPGMTAVAAPRFTAYEGRDNEGKKVTYYVRRDGDDIVTSFGMRIPAPKPGSGVNVVENLRSLREKAETRKANFERQAAHCARMIATYEAASKLYAAEAADAAREERRRGIEKLAGDLMSEYGKAAPFTGVSVPGFEKLAEHVQKLIDDAVAAVTKAGVL